MNIYRVTTERGFTDEVLDSTFFASRDAAEEYAMKLSKEREEDGDYERCTILVALYSAEDGGEFSFNFIITEFYP